MRTLKGYEAVEVAERYNTLLYHVPTQSEVNAQDARADIQNHGSATGYVLEAWPDTEEEAEQLVLKSLERRLRDTRKAHARADELISSVNGSRIIHPVATELALQRLVTRGTLVMRENADDVPIYVLPRTLAVTDTFIEQLRGVVCDDCASLDLDAPFHESCLLQLFDFLHQHQVTLDDLQEVTPTVGDVHEEAVEPAAHEPSSGMQWLSRTAAVTRSRWKNVLPPMLRDRITARNESGKDNASEAGADSPTGQAGKQTSHYKYPVTSVDSEVAAPSGSPSSTTGRTSGAFESQERPKVTKKELIQYLQSVEVLDDGELQLLQIERKNLLRELEQKEAQIRQLRQQKSQVESQFAGLQQDMDVLVRAMRIAREHGSAPPTEMIIDTKYERDEIEAEGE